MSKPKASSNISPSHSSTTVASSFAFSLNGHSPLVRPLSSPKRRPLTNGAAPRTPISGIFMPSSSHHDRSFVPGNGTPPPVGTPVMMPPLSSVVVHGIGLSGSPAVPHHRNTRRTSPSRTPPVEDTKRTFLTSSASMSSLSTARMDDGHSSGYGQLHDWQHGGSGHDIRPGTAPSSLKSSMSMTSLSSIKKRHHHTSSLSSSSSILTVHDINDTTNDAKLSATSATGSTTSTASSSSTSLAAAAGRRVRSTNNKSSTKKVESTPRIGTNNGRDEKSNDEKKKVVRPPSGSSRPTSSSGSSTKKAVPKVSKQHSLSAKVNVAAAVSWKSAYDNDLDIVIDDNDDDEAGEGAKKATKSSQLKKKDAKTTSNGAATSVVKPRRLLASSSLPSLPRRLTSRSSAPSSLPSSSSSIINTDGSVGALSGILVDIPSLLQLSLSLITIISEYALAPRYLLLIVTPRNAAHQHDSHAYLFDVPMYNTSHNATSSIIAKRFYRFHRFDGIRPNIDIVSTRSNRMTIAMPSTLAPGIPDMFNTQKHRVMDIVDATTNSTSIYRLRAPPAATKRKFMQLVSYDNDAIVTCHHRTRGDGDVGDDSMMTSFGHTILGKPSMPTAATSGLLTVPASPLPPSSPSPLGSPYNTRREQYWLTSNGRAAANTPLGGVDDEKTTGGCRVSVHSHYHALVTCGGRWYDRYLVTLLIYPEYQVINEIDPIGYCYDRYAARWHNVPRPWSTNNRTATSSSSSSGVHAIDIIVGHSAAVYCWATTDHTGRGDQRAVAYTPPSPAALRESNTGTQRIAWPWRVLDVPPLLATIHAKESQPADTSSEGIAAIASSLFYSTRYRYGVSLPHVGAILLFAGFLYETHAQLSATCDRVCLFDPSNDTYRILSWQLPLVIGKHDTSHLPYTSRGPSKRAGISSVQIAYVNGLLIMMGTEHVVAGTRWDGTRRIGLAPFVTRHIDNNNNIVAPIEVQTNCYILNLAAMCDMTRPATGGQQLPERVALDHWHCIQRAIPDTMEDATSCVI